LTLGLLSVILFFPSRGWCVTLDPYAFHTVIGTVFFEYEHESRRERESDFLDKTSNFRQDYGLSLRGNLFSRLLMTYDVSFDFERETVNTNFTKYSTNTFFFDISTTLLPKSRIPLTLFANRSNSTFSVEGQDSSGTPTTTLGLNWTGKFRVLPVMNFNLTRNIYGSGDRANKDTRIFFNADKEYGPTSNRFQYSGDFNDNSSGSSTSITNLGFNNITRLSKHSTFDMGLTRDISDAVDESGPTRTFGLTMGLNSHPSRFFNQSHHVAYFRTDAPDSSFHGTTYSGSLQYHLSRKISSNLSLGVSKVFTETPTSSSDSTSTDAASSLSYALSEHFSATEAVSFSFTESSSSEQALANLSDRKILNATTNLNYHRSFSRASFSASYGVGYLYDTDISLDQPNNGGQAITHNGSLSLNRIDFNRFFFFDTGLSFRRVLKTTEGTVNHSINRYRASMYNRFWKKYIQIRGSFDKYNEKTAVSELEEKGETSSLTLTSSPVKGGRVSLSLQRILFFNDFTGFSHSNTGYVSAGYGHKLLGGNLHGGINYSIVDRTFSGGADTTRTTSYELGYERNLLRRVMWRFNALRSDTKVENVFSRNTSFSNVAFYRLRAWSLSVEHTYSIEEDSTTEYRDNRIFFRIGRQFVRMF